MIVYNVMRGGEVVTQITAASKHEDVRLVRAREPNALGSAPYDPLIDIAYESIKKGWNRTGDQELIDRVGGMEHVEAMRSQVRL
jgi:hypothetical protein